MKNVLNYAVAGMALCLLLSCSKNDTSSTAKATDAPAPTATEGPSQPPATEKPSVAAAEAPQRPAAATKPAGCFWPQFHGPKNDNISTDTGLLKQWPEGGPKLLWTAKGLGAGYASVAIANGMIYTSGNVDEQSMVIALDMDGNILWKTPNGPAYTKSYPGSRGTPTVDGDRVYHENPTGDLICLNAKTGEKIWAKNILTDFEAGNITWALAESVLIDGDRLICCPGGPKVSVVALNKKTGDVVWTAKSTGDLAGYATPRLIEYQGLRIILTMNQKALIGVNADDGDLLFRHEHLTKYDINATTPEFKDGQIFITSGYGSGAEMLKLKVEGKTASVEKLWDSKTLDNHHGGLVVLDGVIYGSSFSGKWVCLDWADGQPKWTDRLVGKGSLTYADGMLYILSEKSRVGLVPANPNEAKLVSEFKLPDDISDTSWAHPVVCGGRLYIRHADQLYAFDVKAE